MRLWMIAAAAFFSFASCHRNPEKAGDTDKTVAETETPATLANDCEHVKASEIDYLFDDFLFAFATDSQTQRERIRFPLPLIGENGEKEEVTSISWNMDSLFSHEAVYTIIFNTEEALDTPSKTEIQEGTFEWINPSKGTIKQYNFKRNAHRAWILTDIHLEDLAQNCNADFLAFYQRFVTDEAFQKSHIRKPIEFVTNFTDGNDGFTSDRFTIGIDQWLAWEVPMPVNYLTNIVYGPSCTEKTPSLKILCLRAMDGAYFKALYFRKAGDTWRLYKYEDTAY